MSDLDDFITEYAHELTAGKRSVLEPYKAEILQMKQLGFTEKLILKFLAEKKNLTVSQQALNRFIRSRLKNTDVPMAEMQKKHENVNNLTDSKKTVPDINQPIPATPRQQPATGKFDWQKPIDVEQYK